MGKKKGQGQRRAFKKDPVASKVATGVKKTRTKAVATSLKRMNFQTRAQTKAVDKEFESLQMQSSGAKKSGRPASNSNKGSSSSSSRDSITGMGFASRDSSSAKLEVGEEAIAMATEELEKLTHLSSS